MEREAKENADALLMEDLDNEHSQLLDADGRVAARRKRRFRTPPVEEASGRVITAFDSGCASCMLVGKPRIGKTYAARWICEAIVELFGPLSWFEIPFEYDNSQSEGRFFNKFLRSLPHSYPESREGGVIRFRSEEFLIERAKDSKTGTVVLLLDEAQNLTERHWVYLAELSNKIDRAGLSLFTLSTGQPSLYIVRNGLRELPGKQNGEFIIGRFFVEMIDFRGLQSLEDIRLTLAEVDASPLGPNDKRLWLESALPIAYAAGWCLQDISELIWEAYSEIWADSGRKTTPEIPMTYFDLLIRKILGSPQVFNKEKCCVGLMDVKQLITDSQFEQYIG